MTQAFLQFAGVCLAGAAFVVALGAWAEYLAKKDAGPYE